MIFSDYYLAGLIKEALGFKLMTTAASWCFSNSSHSDSWFCCFRTTSQNYTDDKNIFQNSFNCATASWVSQNYFLAWPQPCRRLMCTTNGDIKSLLVFKQAMVPFEPNPWNSTYSLLTWRHWMDHEPCKGWHLMHWSMNSESWVCYSVLASSPFTEMHKINFVNVQNVLLTY